MESGSRPSKRPNLPNILINRGDGLPRYSPVPPTPASEREPRPQTPPSPRAQPPPPSHLPPIPAEEFVQVYKRRWYVLAVFSAIGLIQGIVWNTWGPISNSAIFVFGWSEADIALFPNIGNILYCLFVFAASYIMDVLGLRVATVLASGLIFVAAGIRCITSEPHSLFWLSSAAAVLNGVAGTVSFAAPALFSSTWFPPNQRTTSTAIISMCNYVGVSASLLIGPQIVHYNGPDRPQNHSSEYSMMSNESTVMPVTFSPSNMTAEVMREKKQIMELLYIEAGISGFIFLLVLLYFPARPPKPPSISATATRVNFAQGLKELTFRGKFWLLALAYGIPTGVVGIWCSVLNINLHSVGITQDEAGMLGFYYVTAGALTGLVVSRFSDIFAEHTKTIIIVLYVLASIDLTWVLLLCEFYIPFSKAQLYASVIIVGIFVNGAIPLFYELACEICYPVAEGITGGYLTFINNFVGVILLFMFDIPNIGKSWLNWTMLFSTAVGIPLLLFLRESYGRLHMDATGEEDEEIVETYRTPCDSPRYTPNASPLVTPTASPHGSPYGSPYLRRHAAPHMYHPSPLAVNNAISDHHSTMGNHSHPGERHDSNTQEVV